MSFGFSVSDFIAVSGLCWQVYKKCKGSSGNYAELSSEVSALYAVIKETEELLSQQSLTQAQDARLVSCRDCCEAVLKDLDGLLIKYESLGTKSQRTFDRMGFGMQDMSGIRLRLISSVSILNTFNNASSHTNLQKNLDRFMYEVRAGKREGSVVSTKTFATDARNDREVWETLRRELEDIGISSDTITEKRQFILRWFQEAVAVGKLDEEAPSDDDDSSIAQYSLDDLLGDSDGVSAHFRETSTMRVAEGTSGQRTSRELDRERSAMAVTERTAARSTTKEPVPKAQHNYGRIVDAEHTRPPQERRKSRLRVSYLGNLLRRRDKKLLEGVELPDVLRRRDEQLLKAVERSNVRRDKQLLDAVQNFYVVKVEKLLAEGADVHTRDRHGCPMLLYAADSEQIVEMLVSNGADVNAIDKYGVTTLFHAISLGNKGVMRQLIMNGADVDVTDRFGESALFVAAYRGNEAAVVLLLGSGADIELRDSRRYTALMRATGEGHLETVRLLLEKGAAVNAESVYGETALDIAEIRGYTEVATLLRTANAAFGERTKVY